MNKKGKETKNHETVYGILSSFQGGKSPTTVFFSFPNPPDTHWFSKTDGFRKNLCEQKTERDAER